MAGLSAPAQIVQQFRLDAGRTNDHITRHDHHRWIIGHPKLVNDLRHQPQNTPRELKFFASSGLGVVRNF